MEIAPTVTFSASALRAERVAREFEQLFISQMLAPMFKSIGAPTLFGGGEGEKAFSSLLHEQFAKAIAAHGGFGVADQVKAEIIKLQAASHSPPTGSQP